MVKYVSYSSHHDDIYQEHVPAYNSHRTQEWLNIMAMATHFWNTSSLSDAVGK